MSNYSNNTNTNANNTSPLRIQNLIWTEEINETSNNETSNNETSNDEFLNLNISGNNKRKRAQQSINASSDRWTEGEIEMLIRLYGEYFRSTNTRARNRSPRRIQLNNKDWEKLESLFKERTGLKRSSNALKGKWNSLKTKYDSKFDSTKLTGVGGGPMEGTDALIHEVLQDDPAVHPYATYDSFTQRLTVNNDLAREKPVVVDDDESTTSPVAQKKRRKSASKEKNSMSEKREDFLNDIKKMSDESLENMKEIMKAPVVVKIEGNEERQQEFHRLNDLLEKIYNKLE